MISIAGWMLDPVVCAGMAIGAPRVDVAALVELQRRLKGAVKTAESRNDVAIDPEENNAVSRDAVGGDGPADELSFEDNRLDGLQCLERDKVVTTLAQILMQAAGRGA